MIIDVAKCQDCNNCFIACKDEHVGNDWPGYNVPQPLHGHRWMNIMRRERGTYPMIDMYYRPTPCMHCDEPACMAAGGGAVTKREDGIVLIDPEKARGRRELVSACPYGAIYWNEEANVAQKCSFCAHLLDSGWEKPRCVQACATGALTVQQLEDGDLAALVQREELQTLHPEKGTKPRVYYKNLSFYDCCFLGGSVSYIKDGLSECAEGAEVRLLQEGKELQCMKTNCYGEFKFDGLADEQVTYTLAISFAGRTLQQEVQLQKSTYVGDICI